MDRSAASTLRRPRRRRRTRASLVLALVLGLVLGPGPAALAEKTARRDLLCEKSRYSQGKEEVVIRDFFQDRRGGVFLDVGSADPIRGSTSYYLEEHLEWTGIAVDALAEYQARYSELRPATRFFAYIVTDQDGTKQEFYRVTKAPDASSTIKDRKWRGHALETETLLVPTITLNTLLDREGVVQIDFLSMDIERGAPKALAGFDIRRFAPKLVCIEAGNSGLYRMALVKYFEDHGYRRIDRYLEHDPANWYYAPRE